jgi:excisionase family DNA binding protein
MAPGSERLLTASEVASRLCVTTRTLYSWVRDGRFPAPLSGMTRLRWREAVVDSFIRDL